MGKIIPIEFQRWQQVCAGSIDGIEYRVSKFSPNGKFKEYVAAIKFKGEWMPFTDAYSDFGGHIDIYDAINQTELYIKRNKLGAN